MSGMASMLESMQPEQMEQMARMSGAPPVRAPTPPAAYRWLTQLMTRRLSVGWALRQSVRTSRFVAAV
jgi:hypothetical protein